jgi:UDP-N-acetylmuramyl pentapeptide phosphotransferase/UDP-N-acetylglucosamine-1-phosphate transferase
LIGVPLGLVVGSALAGVLAGLSVTSAPRRLVRENHRGDPVPAVLGLALLGAAIVGTLIGLLWANRAGPLMAAVLAGMVGLGAAGLLDDLAGDGPRGFRGHLGDLARGRPTTGILKLVVGLAAGVTVAVLIGGGALRVAASAVLVAVSVNLWNALDVAPGRSLKWAIVALVPVLAVTREAAFGVAAAATLGASVGLLPFDLTERGMLGDAGSNPLGFVVGTGLAAALPTAGVLAAAAAAVLLQTAAETVTISRLIEAAPPLRWFDRLGRRP